MKVKLTKTLVESIGKTKFKAFVNENSWSWKSEADVNLTQMEPQKIAALRALMVEHESVRGAKAVIKDIDTWNEALKDATSAKPRIVKQFETLLKRYLFKVPGHRIYSKHDNAGEAWLAHYVSNVLYYAKSTGSHSERPAFVEMVVIWEEFGGRRSKSHRFYEEDCRAMTVVEALARKGFYIETSELRQRYLAEVKRFGEISQQIGKQFWAKGTATDDLDGNPEGRKSSWYWSRTNTIQMEREGSPTRTVIDIFYEDEKSDRRERESADVRTWFWENVSREGVGKGLDDEDNSGTFENEAEQLPEIEIPVHPFCAVFDMSKHLRLRVHVNYLTEYIYDKQMAEKLILPVEQKELVKLLIEHKDAGFQDIVRGKSGGAVVLLAGPPGVGKTLTAEVYAESEERALYSVQCSQLGTDPETLEDELLKVFARSRRWNAVMLLDEADVYVHERGNDLSQNAIVGVFLRVLEYQGSVLFLTTNRPDDVDDAIASCCIARLAYPVPSPADQKRIWRVLADASKIALSDETVNEVVDANPALTGRDVKNLLKLAKLVANGSGKPITKDTIEFVKRFKPTGAPESPAPKNKRVLTDEQKKKMQEGLRRHFAGKSGS